MEHDDYFNNIFNDVFEDSRKYFSEVFKLDNSNGDIKLMPLMPVKIEDHYLDQDIMLLGPLVKLNGELIQNLNKKILVGRKHKFSGVFEIDGWID